MPTVSHEVTALLISASEGDRSAIDRLMPLVYDELRAIAHNHRRNEDNAETLSTTVLVHEAYLKLVDQTRVTWQNRSHFFAIASQAVRRIIIDHARQRLAQKRGGGWVRVPLDGLDGGAELSRDGAARFLALDEALERLGLVDARQARVVECRFFGGLTVGETAEALGISPATVKREWSMAKAWLHRELADEVT